MPAVLLRQPGDKFSESVTHHRKTQQKPNLFAYALPIHQDQREDTPNRDVIHAGVPKDPLAYRQAQDFELFHEKDQDG